MCVQLVVHAGAWGGDTCPRHSRIISLRSIVSFLIVACLFCYGLFRFLLVFRLFRLGFSALFFFSDFLLSVKAPIHRYNT